MKIRTMLVSLALAFLLAGCGDDGRVMTDSGVGTDTGVDTSTPDTSGPGTPVTISMRYLDPEESPLADVKVAIDSDLGRFEGVTDAAGELVLVVRYMDSAELDSIAALEGYRIVSRVDAVWEPPDTDDGYAEITLGELDPDLGDTVRIVAGATGVPTGGRWCVALIAWFQACQAEGDTWDNRLRMGQFEDGIQDYVYGYALDDSGALYDFARADWTVNPDGGRSVTLAFDGTLSETPTERDFTLNLPSDPESAFRTETLDETWQGWMTAVEPGTHLSRSALTMVSVGADAVTMRMHSFPVMDDELVWASAAYASLADQARSFIWYSTAPAADAIDILDLPRVRSGSTPADEFEWTEPADDIEGYFLQFYNNGGVVSISLGTDNPYATLPALPTGYDTSVSYPFPGAPGQLQVIAYRGELPPDDMATDPYRVDADAAFSLRHPITF